MLLPACHSEREPNFLESIAMSEARYACTFPTRSLDQETYGICGSIAVLHACALEAPDRFENFAKEVCSQGGRLVPQALIDELKGPRRSNTLARIMSAYLINQQNSCITYKGGDSCMSFLESAAMPKDIIIWCRKFFPERKIVSYASYFWGALDNADKINKLWANPTKSPVVIALINPRRLQGTKDSTGYHLRGVLGLLAGSHFIHILSPFKKENGRVCFEAYDNGINRKYDVSENKFAQSFHEIIAAY